MKRLAAATLGLSLLAAPLLGLADEGRPSKDIEQRPGAQWRPGYGSCHDQGVKDGWVREGTVVGLGGSWGGPAFFWFAYNSNGVVTTERPHRTAATDEGRAMQEVLHLAYLTGATVYLRCDGVGTTNAAWLDQYGTDLGN